MVLEVQEHHLLPSVQTHQPLPSNQADHLHPGYFKQGKFIIRVSINANEIKKSKIFCYFYMNKVYRGDLTYRRSSEASRPRRTTLTTVTLQRDIRDCWSEWAEIQLRILFLLLSHFYFVKNIFSTLCLLFFVHEKKNTEQYYTSVVTEGKLKEWQSLEINNVQSCHHPFLPPCWQG